MASKKEILKNITNYTPEEIADAVRSGVVSMYELGKNTEGAFTPLLRKRVKELLEQTPMPTVENDKENVSEIEILLYQTLLQQKICLFLMNLKLHLLQKNYLH